MLASIIDKALPIRNVYLLRKLEISLTLSQNAEIPWIDPNIDSDL